MFPCLLVKDIALVTSHLLYQSQNILAIENFSYPPHHPPTTSCCFLRAENRKQEPGRSIQLGHREVLFNERYGNPLLNCERRLAIHSIFMGVCLAEAYALAKIIASYYYNSSNSCKVTITALCKTEPVVYIHLSLFFPLKCIPLYHFDIPLH